MMFMCKVFATKNDVLVAICDEELLGKEIEFKEQGVKIKISEKFYGGRKIDERVAIRLMERATIGNLVGKKIVELASKKGFVTKENILVISGIPHAQFLKL